MKTFTPVPKQYYLLILIIIVNFMHFTMCVNMWTSLEQKQANNKTPAKKCVSPCRIFHTWCKNDGKCREKGPDCTWYCECPSNCEGFFCEKIVEKGVADGGQKVEVKVTYQKDKKKNVSAFDKSKLAQALAGIFMKEKKTDEEKKTSLPDREGNTIDTKENLTTNIIINCPPGSLPPDSPISQTAEITNEAKTNDSITQGSPGQGLQSILEQKANVSGKFQNHSTSVNKPVSTVTSGNQSVNTHSSVTPIVKTSFSVTYSTTTTKQVTEENVSNNSNVLQDTATTTTVTTSVHTKLSNENTLISTSVTPSSKQRIELTMLPYKSTPSSQRQESTTRVPYSPSTTSHTTETTAADKTINNFTTNEVSDKHLLPAQENSLYIKNENVIETTNKPDLLKIIEKAIEVEFITTDQQQSSTSTMPVTTESVLVHKGTGLSSAKIEAKATMPVSEGNFLSTSTEVNLLKKSDTSPKASAVISSVIEKEKTQNSSDYNRLKNESSTTAEPLSENINTKKTTLNSKRMSESRTNTSSTTPMAGTSSVPTTKISADNKIDLNLKSVPNKTQGKHYTSNKMNLTFIAVKTSQTTGAYDTSKNQPASSHQGTFSKSTVTPFNTTFGSTTSTKTGTENSETIRQNLATDKTKNNSNLSKAKTSEYMVINKSQSENSATGDINSMSAVNGQPLNMTGSIITSHDMPKQTDPNISRIQTDMSSLSTNSQYISRNVTESVKVIASPSLSSENNKSLHLQRRPKNYTISFEKLNASDPSKNAAQEVVIESTTPPIEDLYPEKQTKTGMIGIQVISPETTETLQQLDQSINNTENVTVVSTSTPEVKNVRLKTDDHQREVTQSIEENSANPSNETSKRLQSGGISKTAQVPTATKAPATGLADADADKTVKISASVKPGTSSKLQETGPVITKHDTTSETPTAGKEPDKNTQNIKHIEQNTQPDNNSRKNTFSNDDITTMKLPDVTSTSQTYESSSSSTISVTNSKEGTTNSSPVSLAASTTRERANFTSVYSDTVKLDEKASEEPKTTQSTTSTKSSSTPQMPTVSTLTSSTVISTETYTEQNASDLAMSTGASDTSQPQANEFVSTTESYTKTDDTTKYHSKENVLKTSSDLSSADLPVVEHAKMSLAKAFFENQSDLLKQSKVKNEILTNKLSESVKDLNFDLLKTKLQDKGLPSDIDNIL